jgi:hypothetical protein
LIDGKLAVNGKEKGTTKETEDVLMKHESSENKSSRKEVTTILPDQHRIEIQSQESQDSSDREATSSSTSEAISLEYEFAYSDSDGNDLSIEDYELGHRKPENRLLNSERYFENLRDLESEVISNSCLSSFHTVNQPSIIDGSWTMPETGSQGFLQAVTDYTSESIQIIQPAEVRMPFKKVEEVIVTLFRSEYT